MKSSLSLSNAILLLSLLTPSYAGLIPALNITNAVSSANAVPNQYIITLKPSATSNDLAKLLSVIGVSNVLQKLNIGGFNALVTNSAVQMLGPVLQALGFVDTIEPDYIAKPFAFTTQSNAPHGLDQISHRTPSTSNLNFITDDSLAQNTCSYVIDTGVQRNHPELNGRSYPPVFCVGSGGCKANSNTNGSPYGSHGTMVAGVLAGNTVGVARKGKYLDLQVFASDPTSGATSVVLSALQYALAHYQANANGDCKGGASINLSFGYQPGSGDQPSSLATAINRVVQAGMFVAAAAGNDNADAATYIPASVASACTVGAVDGRNVKASWSNYGSVIDVWAPGTSILSAASNSGYATADGTSFSTPMLAGLGMYLQSYCGAATGRKKTPVDLCNYIKSSGTAFSLNAGGVATGYVGFNGGSGSLCSGW